MIQYINVYRRPCRTSDLTVNETLKEALDEIVVSYTLREVDEDYKITILFDDEGKNKPEYINLSDDLDEYIDLENESFRTDREHEIIESQLIHK